MAKTKPWHSEEQSFYHNRSDCSLGGAVPEQARVLGTGARGLCAQCSALRREKSGPPRAARTAPLIQQTVLELRAALLATTVEAELLIAPDTLIVGLTEALNHLATSPNSSMSSEEAFEEAVDEAHEAHEALEAYRAWRKR